MKDTELELIGEAEFLEKAPAELKEGLTLKDGKPDSYKHQLMLRRLQHEEQCRIEVQAATSLAMGRAAACLEEAAACLNKLVLILLALLLAVESRLLLALLRGNCSSSGAAQALTG